MPAIIADAVVTFPAGLPGFEDQRRFVLTNRAELAPLVFLQSLDSQDLCFTALPVSAIDPHYELSLSAEDQQRLGRDGDLLVLAILAAAENGRWTANLLAPVVIQVDARTGVQAVRSDSRYSHCHCLTPEAMCW